MKKLLPLALLLAALPSFAQFGNVIHRVEPNNGPVSGGTLVTITGDFSIEPITSPPCMGAEVWIGGRQADVVGGFSTSRVDVRTRSYTPGRFDVVVSRCGVNAVRENGFVYRKSQEQAFAERALLPVIFPADIPGAFGSLWRTEFRGWNPTAAQRVTGQPNLVCAIPEGCPTTSGPFTPTFPPNLVGPGRLLYVEGFNAERLNATVRVRDLSRSQESLGTELPTIWEDETYGPRSGFVIPDVPHGENYRARLRLYRIDVAEPATLLLRLQNDSVPIGQDINITLSPGVQDETYLLQPPYAELDLDGLFGAASGQRSVYVQTPAEGLYWGFVSVTNNVTQQITTVTP